MPFTQNERPFNKTLHFLNLYQYLNGRLNKEVDVLLIYDICTQGEILRVFAY